MLSSQSNRQIVTIYSMGFASLLLVGIIMIYFYKHIQHENIALEKQKDALLLEKSHYVDFQKNKIHDKMDGNVLSLVNLCSSDALLKQKIIFWVQQSKAQLVAIRFGTGITINVVGSFSQDLGLLVALANTQVVFDINTIELFLVKNGIELRMTITHDAVCD